MHEETIETAPPAPLPELQQSILDPETFQQLFRDIAECAEVSEVIPKYGAAAYVPETGALTLAEGCAMLARNELRGLQVRYRYDNADWWDTLMKTPTGIRLTRIRHCFEARE
jgi:hypothetical protein